MGLFDLAFDRIGACMVGTVIAAGLVMWGLSLAMLNGRRLVGTCVLTAGVGLFFASVAFGMSAIQPPYCPPGERLHGAAGRILWCAP